ncbi:putative amino acid transporter [Leishmania infantum JPCM5]|uniref:Amino_acid_transporter_19_-_putative n=2 Tax=Leishmania infantum TaxID=5671 RepID=A0A6L0WT74_LEIIN|nr:putative amino acid transporter [Leishmania infantum JPCM5]CAC9449963.1 amino_acid_transporter_19_-_putative [Leishmania infantum]CAM65691.1 putative amino acid transporter [Leishmania infantum JPCM5]SUZ39315.1 amino_acid_transporter_19_-_putative [Leishmania infantum]|eukprot:XP_001463333.1 putative amino acid transporter [Leishmania infantum JPCM5]
MSRLPGEPLSEAAQRELTAPDRHPEDGVVNTKTKSQPSGITDRQDDNPELTKKPHAEADDTNTGEAMDDDDAEAVAEKKHYSKFRLWFQKLVPPGGVIASSFTLGSSTLGAGILGLPAAFNSMGFVTALLVLIVVTVLTIFSLWLLARCSDASKVRTYEDVARVLLGRGADYAAAVFMLGFCLGGAVSYIISIGDLLTPIFDDPSVPELLRTKIGNSIITSAVWLVVILPLCLPKNIDSLRHTSIISVTMVVFFVICIMQDSCEFMAKNGWRKDIKFFNTGNGAIQGLGTVIFACLVQINAQEVYYEMANPTPRNMVRNSTIAMSGCGLLYVLAGVFGCARFGSTVKSSILLKYQPREAPQFWFAYFGIVVKICVAFALHQLPLRDSVYHFFSWDVYRMPWWRNALICGGIAAFVLVVGLLVPDLNIVLGLVGSLCGGFIGFIFPSLMIMYAGKWSLKNVGLLEWSLTYILLLVGVVAVVFGTCASIYSIV